MQFSTGIRSLCVCFFSVLRRLPDQLAVPRVREHAGAIWLWAVRGLSSSHWAKDGPTDFLGFGSGSGSFFPVADVPPSPLLCWVETISSMCCP